MAFGSSYRQARKTEGNRDSSEFLGYYSLEFIISIRVPHFDTRTVPFSTNALDVAGYSAVTRKLSIDINVWYSFLETGLWTLFSRRTLGKVGSFLRTYVALHTFL